MAYIQLNNVAIDFPVFNVNSRSLKNKFLRLATGGNVSKDANKHYFVRSLSDITLTLNHGDRLGLIGHNGAGKSTLLRLLANIYEPTSGQIAIEGKVSSLLNIMHGIEPEFTGFDNILQRGIILGLTKKQIFQQIESIKDMTGLGDYLSMPVRTYSSGMLVRLAFAISTSINPEILLIDEVFGAGDASFLDKARQRMIDLLGQSSIVVLASHSHALIQEFCNKAILLEGGCIKYFGSVEETIAAYESSR